MEPRHITSSPGIAPIYFPVFGQSVEARMLRELDVQPVEQLSHLRTLKNNAGEDSGFIKVYAGERIEKAISLSMHLAPGLRYFFVHIVADPNFDIPRYSFDGLLTDQGSRVALDLNPDFDLAMNLDYLTSKCQSLAGVYQSATEDEKFAFEASRLAHIRAICSPYFLGVFSVLDPDLPRLEAYADAYFSEWLAFFRTAEPITAEAANQKRQRRTQINNAIIKGNYMNPVVAEVYDEGISQAVYDAICA